MPTRGHTRLGSKPKHTLTSEGYHFTASLPPELAARFNSFMEKATAEPTPMTAARAVRLLIDEALRAKGI